MRRDDKQRKDYKVPKKLTKTQKDELNEQLKSSSPNVGYKAKAPGEPEEIQEMRKNAREFLVSEQGRLGSENRQLRMLIWALIKSAGGEISIEKTLIHSNLWDKRFEVQNDEKNMKMTYRAL